MSKPREILRTLRWFFIRYEYRLSIGDNSRVVRTHPRNLARKIIVYAGKHGVAPWQVKVTATDRQAARLNF